MSRSPLEELSKEDLLKGVYGENIAKIVLNKIWQEKVAEKKEGLKPSKEAMKNRWDVFKRINRAIGSTSAMVFFAAIFPMAILALWVLYLNARAAGNHLLDITQVVFAVIFIFAILNGMCVSAVDSKINKINSKLEALIALLSKSNVIDS